MRIERTKPPEPGHAIRVQAEGADIAIFNVGGRLLGIDAKCTHAGGPLDQGHVDGTIVTCPLHGSQFDLQTGAVRRGPATRPVRSYRVRAEAGGLIIEAQ